MYKRLCCHVSAKTQIRSYICRSSSLCQLISSWWIVILGRHNSVNVNHEEKYLIFQIMQNMLNCYLRSSPGGDFSNYHVTSHTAILFVLTCTSHAAKEWCALHTTCSAVLYICTVWWSCHLGCLKNIFML